MDAPANTISYMIAGYAVIFGIMFIYLTSLVVRWHNLSQDEKLLQDLIQQDE